ncbi:MAG: hypothetical protein AAF514_07205, partial [Verrucomicrobiota bacterium]
MNRIPMLFRSLVGFLCILGPAVGQEAPLVHLSRSAGGSMELQIEGRADNYYILYRGQDLTKHGEAVAMALGGNGTLTLRDRYAISADQVFYRVLEVPTNQSRDTDGDGRLDFRELRENIFKPGFSVGNPLNPVDNVRPDDGSYRLDLEGFENYSIDQGQGSGITPGLTGQRFMKFVGFPPDQPKDAAVYFMNTRRHRGHGQFLSVLADQLGVVPPVVFRGEMA